MGASNNIRITIFILLSSFLTGCSVGGTIKTQPATTFPTETQQVNLQTPTSQPTIEPTISTPTPAPSEFAWWNDTVFYEIFVRSFYDSDGDGIGDFNGIIKKLDYLNDGDPTTTTDLGITGIWLMPINPSPSYHGYDVTDYYDVNPDYGTMQDFTNLVKECHARGIRVIIDLVLNHTSIMHPWFIEARDQPTSLHHDWYIWSDTNPGYLGPWDEVVWYPSSAGYYYAMFSSSMPDLNYKTDAVTTEMHNVAKFWLQAIGVDGFRLDAARYLVELDKSQADTQFTHQWWKNFRTYYKGINPQAMTVGEVWTNNFEVVDYVKGDELDMAFNFDLASQIIRAVSSWNVSSLRLNLENSYEKFPRGTYATFLTNHDQNRVMSVLIGDLDKAKLAASVLLTTPGTPFIYYGEEIGMIGSKPDENIRTPMLWSAGEYAGFSTVTPWENLNSDYEQMNVENESGDSNSLLSHYRTLINLRNEHSALRTGDYYTISGDSRSILSFLRVNEGEILLTLINISKKPVSGFSLFLSQGPLAGSYSAHLLYGSGTVNFLSANSTGGFDTYQPAIEISPAGLVIIELR